MLTICTAPISVGAKAWVDLDLIESLGVIIISVMVEMFDITQDPKVKWTVMGNGLPLSLLLNLLRLIPKLFHELFTRYSC
ncbi:hypothetical protein [Candidatus Pandoraea novymonadis]|uniref:hypothetical protein n=1 Tax=Candidatus Pandoraea novymonadis TaxID=1808959 RepID=UPI0015E7D70A|nr:hypothetical protein [Candidatus Pandoraea novymonadis]